MKKYSFNKDGLRLFLNGISLLLLLLVSITFFFCPYKVAANSLNTYNLDTIPKSKESIKKMQELSITRDNRLDFGQIFMSDQSRNEENIKIKCNQGVSVECIASGAKDNTATTLMVPTPETVDSVIVEIAYQYFEETRTPPDFVTIIVNGETRNIPQAEVNGNIGAVFFRGIIRGGVRNVTYMDNANFNANHPDLLESVKAYVFRRSPENTKEYSVQYVGQSGVNNLRTFNVPLPSRIYETAAPRNMVVTVPISDVFTEDKYLKVKVEAGGVADSITRTFVANDFPTGCCFYNVEIPLNNVVGETNVATVTIESRNPDNNGPEPNNGHSWMVGSVLIASECPDCIDPTPQRDTLSGCPNTRLRKSLGINDFNLQNPRFSIPNPTVNRPKNGTVTLLQNGELTYVPNDNFCGRDTFIYRVCNNGEVVEATCCSSARVFINVEDNEGPSFRNFPNNGTGDCNNLPSVPTVIAADNCGARVTVVYNGGVQTPIEGSCDILLTRTWTATDICGNTTSASQEIILIDTLPPIFENVPADVTISCDGPIPNLMPTATDDCGAVEITLRSDTTFGVCVGNFTITKTWTATDPCENRTFARQIINVQDVQGPIFEMVPADFTISCDEVVPPPDTLNAMDNCGEANISLEIDTLFGNCQGNYTITRTWRAVDNCGNSTLGIQHIVVVDTIPPILLEKPADITISCIEEMPPAEPLNATDNCSEVTFTINEVPIPGDCLVRLNRSWIAKDNCGNTSSTSQVITIVDDTAPVFVNPPADITISCDIPIPSPDSLIVEDACNDLNVRLSEITDNGTCTTTVTRTWTASDICNNSIMHQQIITIIDDQAPTLIGIPADITISCEADVPLPPNVIGNDNCTNVTVSLKADTLVDNCLTILTRTWTGEDECANVTQAIQTISIIDNLEPIVRNIPDDLTISCDETLPEPVTLDISDACNEVTVTFEEEKIGDACFAIINRTWTATDVCGNRHITTQRIRVVDTIPPVLICKDTIRVTATDECEVFEIDLPLPTAVDNCMDSIEITSSRDLSLPFPVGTTEITFSARDDCGNASECELVVVVENLPMMADCPMDTLVACDAELCGAIVQWEPPNGNECCSSCPANTAIEGYRYLGTRGGHRYYLSNQPADWKTASEAAITLGNRSDLVILNDPAENTFIASLLNTNEPVFIGLSDLGSEGDFYWLDGTPLDYTNWLVNEPNNKGNDQHYGILLASGFWRDVRATNLFHYLVEVECVDVLQVSGPMNGSFIEGGDTTLTVTYHIEYDDCMNADTCQFDVSIEACPLKYCETEGRIADCFWIHRIGLVDLDHTSGTDNGYGDYTQFIANLTPGKTETMLLQPGFMPDQIFDLNWTVFIDYNQDGDFEDDGEHVLTKEERRVFHDKGDAPVFKDFTVPLDALPGRTRMRVAVKFTEKVEPCGKFVFGEVQDYTVNIQAINARNTITSTGKVEQEKAFYQFKQQTQQSWKAKFKNQPTKPSIATTPAVKLYPNPVKSGLSVQLNGLQQSLDLPKINETILLKIYNYQGKIVFTQTLSHSQQPRLLLDVQSLENGLYFVEVEDQFGRKYTEKFTKF